MKTKTLLAPLVLLQCSLGLHAQGTFVYDQQSVTGGTSGEFGFAIQSRQPIGQSFTPALSSIGFVRLYLYDSAFNGIGATVYVNLRTNSITGAILGSTQPVFMPDGFGDLTNFFFGSEVPLVPATTYFLQPVVQSGDVWNVVGDNNFMYPGGTAFLDGLASPSFDLWFREGIIVPEPSSAALLLFGLAAFSYAHRLRMRRKEKV